MHIIIKTFWKKWIWIKNKETQKFLIQWIENMNSGYSINVGGPSQYTNKICNTH